MSQENAEIVTSLVEAWNGADLEAILTLFHPDCEVSFPPEVPEPGPFQGHAELRSWAEGFLAAWESHQAEVVELIVEGDLVLAMLHLTRRGSGSEIVMDETDAHLFTLRRQDHALAELPRAFGGPRSRPAVGVGDVGGERRAGASRV